MRGPADIPRSQPTGSIPSPGKHIPLKTVYGYIQESGTCEPLLPARNFEPIIHHVIDSCLLLHMREWLSNGSTSFRIIANKGCVSFTNENYRSCSKCLVEL